MDELMNLVASRSAPLDPNDMPLSSLIESSNASLDLILLVGITLATTMLLEETMFLGLFLVTPLITLATPTTILMEITIDYPLI